MTKRARTHDLLTAVLDEPLAIDALAGSGAEQAPAVTALLVEAGLRALHQPSPPGVAVYLKPSVSEEHFEGLTCEQALLWLMCARAPQQAMLERQYSQSRRRPLLARRFGERLRKLRPAAELDEAIAVVEAAARPVSDDLLWSGAVDAGLLEAEAEAEAAFEEAVRRAVALAAAAMRVTEQQIEREWLALMGAHSSLANACLWRFCVATGMHLQDATVLTSAAAPDRARIVLLLYDRTVHSEQQRPRRFAWVPALSKLLATLDSAALAQQMVAQLWECMRRTQQIYVPSALRTQLEALLTEWFKSSLTTHGGLRVRASFMPRTQLCLYMHGAAGAGKSSSVRALLPALVATVRASLHPEMQGGFVKQTLNKTLPDLALEFDRRPNNNDLSVVSVIEMAREPLTATEPRLLLLSLEEMPPSSAEDPARLASGAAAHEAAGEAAAGEAVSTGDAGASPADAQLAVCSLLAEVFKRSAAHPDLVVCLTSNYALSPAAEETLRGCSAFKTVRAVPVAAVEGDERRAFAHAFLSDRLGRALMHAHGGAAERAPTAHAAVQAPKPDDAALACELASALTIEIDLELGGGDVRPLVRHLRCLAAYAASMLTAHAVASVATLGEGAVVAAAQAAAEDRRRLGLVLRIAPAGTPQQGTDEVRTGELSSFAQPLQLALARDGAGQGAAPIQTLSLRPGAHGNFAATDGRHLDSHTRAVMDLVARSHPDDPSLPSVALVVDLFLAGALAPAVLLCTSRPGATAMATTLLDALAEVLSPAGSTVFPGIGHIRDVDVTRIKMNKSLYDARDERSLRDEILDIKARVPRAAVELLAPNTQAELQIREMVEDSPSLVAHSVHKRILHKDGLLFVVRVGANDPAAITPELISRASIVL